MGAELRSTAAYRAEIGERIAEGPYAATWESLSSYQVPAWYEDAKFGIFIHWGPFSVPAFGGGWYGREMYIPGSTDYEHHLKTYGPPDKVGYKDIIAMFKAERFDPDAWAGLFRRAGAQFVVPVAEHHDGFAMYDCGFSRWNAVEMGPKRDLIGELADAVRRQWLTFGLSSHRAEHWWFMNSGMAIESDVRDPRYADLYGPAQPEGAVPNEQFLEDFLVRTCELVDKYQPQLVWFDWWIEEPAFAPYLQEFASYYYNRGLDWRKGVAINYKYKAFAEGAAVLDLERGQLAGIRNQMWQNDTAVDKTSWVHNETPDYKPVGDLVGDLVDIVSKNGALLLNIGPRADGTIPDGDRDILLGIGDWLRVNGEAIYGTRPWRVYGEGPTQVIEGPFADTKRASFTAEDIRFTTRASTSHGEDRMQLYATALAVPDDRTVRIRTLGSASEHAAGGIAAVRLVTGQRYSEPALAFRQTGEMLEIDLPADLPSDHAVSVRIDLGSA